MATLALPRLVPAHKSSSTITTLSASIALDSISTAPVPNKHIPVCPPGPVPRGEPNTPPPSPESSLECQQGSLLFPPDTYPRLNAGALILFKLDAAGVASAIDHISRQPLPDPLQVFPWFHGLHPSNHLQQAFFIQRRRVLRRTPQCFRGITIVKADGDLTECRLKGAIAPSEFMHTGLSAEFLEVDPRDGFSVRNFQIQAAKMATISDIIVYGNDEVQVRQVAWDISAAQLRWREKHEEQGYDLPRYNTFICTAPFSEFEHRYDEMVAINSRREVTGAVVDFFLQERAEMYSMTSASEISAGVWMGPTPDQGSEDERRFDVLIECSDLGRLNPGVLQAISHSRHGPSAPIHLEFPSSGSILPPTWSQSEADGILETCKWIYRLSHGTRPQDEDCPQGEDEDEIMEDGDGGQPQRLKILIHCADGYTESTMLGLAYFSYSTGLPIHDAWLQLHKVKKRNFFAYPTDVALLTAIALRILRESPVCAEKSPGEITSLVSDEPRWMASLDGSFPSRILDYMYLGNLGHANNPDLLRAMGITQILSVGETSMWRDGELELWGEDNVCIVEGVQDNGIDPLTDEFERCLDFIERGRRKGTATLVHCRVGVSRSATICIAEVMRSLNLSFPRAYCFVRARRLNVIIQPHLRFAYELLKWEELLQTRRQEAGVGTGIKRELEWGEISREVALMNRPYAR
ncbi:hypothetical protein MKZ38_002014 [Zalerion maritima]|uniref:Protein-tyrosine-phosphatase n=1 Tax=Zalerion maritima TaxID=339359 RepID=A0AAD5RQE5_9PEZI|nr:hypothetical protein MKZ38_002014 [Zalerion maritima]